MLQNIRNKITYLSGRTIFFVIVNILIAALICKLRNELNSKAFGNTLTFIGLGYMILGVLAFAGGYGAARNINYHISNSVSAENSEQRRQRDAKAEVSNINFSVKTICFGAVTLIVALIISLL